MNLLNKCGSCPVALDYGILGSSEFVQGLLSGVDKREKETLRLSSKIKSLTCVYSRYNRNIAYPANMEDKKNVFVFGRDAL